MKPGYIDREELEYIFQDMYDAGYSIGMENIEGKEVITIQNWKNDEVYTYCSCPIIYEEIYDILDEAVDRVRDLGFLVKLEVEKGFLSDSGTGVSPQHGVKFDNVPETIDLKYYGKGGGMNIGPEAENWMKQKLYGKQDYSIAWIRVIIEEKSRFNRLKSFLKFEAVYLNKPFRS